jgi:hemerythrin-like metal-binding protein
LGKLIQYTRTHFSDEEAMLAAAKYPKLADHKAQHVELMNKVEDFAARHKRGEITVNLQLMTFLRDWLANHIQKVDRDDGPWLNEHGVR